MYFIASNISNLFQHEINIKLFMSSFTLFLIQSLLNPVCIMPLQNISMKMNHFSRAQQPPVVDGQWFRQRRSRENMTSLAQIFAVILYGKKGPTCFIMLFLIPTHNITRHKLQASNVIFTWTLASYPLRLDTKGNLYASHIQGGAKACLQL